MSQDDQKQEKNLEKEVEVQPAPKEKDPGQPEQEADEGPQKQKDDVPAASPRRSPRKRNKVNRLDPGSISGESGTESQREKETKRIPSPRAPAGPPPAFHRVKHLRLKLTPRTPRLPMEPRRVLQVKRAPVAAHPGGISTEVTIEGFGHEYTSLLYARIR